MSDLTKDYVDRNCASPAILQDQLNEIAKAIAEIRRTLSDMATVLAMHDKELEALDRPKPHGDNARRGY